MVRFQALGLIALAAALCANAGAAQTLLAVDASASTPAPVEGTLKLGTALAPGGHSLAANNRYLLRDGKPWLPVMGEFHYTRSPASSWAAELRKMKAAGIDIVASYVIWSHHEPRDGEFDWKANRDLHRFLQLAHEAGLLAVVRIGPWAHAEVRYGGVPEWVVNSMPTRQDDPQYLRAVERLYTQIGSQLKGQLWKDGGPVIGIQLENEFNLRGPSQGEGHIRTLKNLALKAGMDVPLYTVTGWDGTVYPSGEVTPVFGGYPDEPWGVSTTELPPKETYAFRFGSRVSGDLGAQTAATAPGTAETDMALTPFLGAEYGAGLPAMYRRRTLVSPDDIASMLPVQLGSGVNLMGYYMFHGGRNPRIDLQESTGSGGYNDLPQISYDFQAPLGPDGQQREVLERLRPFHLFMHAFGERLAPMSVKKPERTPADATELGTPRFAVRSDGEHGFLFVNNHVRQYAMPSFEGLRFSVKLPGQTLTLPSAPMTLKDGDYFIWPLHFDLDGTDLAYATAQPVTRIDAGADGIVYVFSQSAGQPVEFAFAAADAAHLQSTVTARNVDGRLVFGALQASTTPVIRITRPGQRPVQVLLLSEAQSRALSVARVAGRERLLISAAQSWLGEKNGLELRSVDEPNFRLAVYPALARLPRGNLPLTSRQDGIFQVLQAQAKPVHVEAQVQQTRAAQAAPPLLKGGLAGGALEPIPEAWRAAASWQIAIDPAALKDVDELLLEPELAGDMARLFSGTRMLDDWYCLGYPWQIGLRQFAAELKRGPLTLSLLPLRADAPIYLPREHRPDFAGQPQVASLKGVHLKPVYRLSLQP